MASPENTDDWSTFQHDMQLSGFQSKPGALNRTNVAGLQLRWTYTSSAAFIASPLAVDGAIYAVDQNGNVVALSNADGSLLWTRSLGQSVLMTPMFSGGKLFVGTHTTPGTLYALDATTGETLWSAQVPGAIRSSPVIVGNDIFIGSASGDKPICSSGGIYSFDVASGASVSTWLTEPGVSDGGAVWAPLSTDGTSVYFGTGNTCVNAPATSDAIISVNASNAGLKWDYASGGLDYFDDDVGGGVMISNGVGYTMAKNGYFFANDLASGALRWKVQLNSLDSYGGFSTATISSGTIAIAAGYNQNPYPLPPNAPSGGTLYGLSTSGAVKWKRQSEYVMLSSAVATPDLIFAEIDNSLQALDPATGQSLWTYATQGGFKASPAVVASGIYAADVSGVLYAFGVSDAQPSASKRSAHSYHNSVLGVTRFVPQVPREYMNAPNLMTQ